MARCNGSGCPNCNTSIENIRSFVHDMRPYLNSFDPGQLFAIFQQQADRLNIHGKEKKLLMHAILARKFSNEDLEKFINGQSSQVDDYFIDMQQPSEENEELKMISDEMMYIDSTDFPYVKTIDVLEALDSPLVANSDVEVINFLVESSVANIWKHAFNDEDQALEQLAYYNGEGVYALEVSKRFKESYEGSKKLIIPDGCKFQYPIKLMQRFTAYSIQQKKRIGNWCGTGAGKTFSAILASRCIDARITIICCPNSVIEGWEKAIFEAYPDSIVLKDLPNKLVHIKPKQFYYLIFNYQFFQQPQTKEKLEIFLRGVKIDFVVIDEIHYSKQRTKKVSERKRVIAFMLAKASLGNDNLCVLGMSATPVINNLFEGRTLLELITGVCYDDLETKATAPNCNSLYQKLITNGIRWLPDYGEKPPLLHYVDCGYLLPSKVRLSGMGSVEAFFMQAKIPLILDQLKSKTIVYIYYLDGILIPLQEAIAQRNWKVAVFTGDDKTGLKKFLAGDADILIGSSCIGTGVDGLQHISDRLVIGSLPWTHAEYKQLIGRLYRQGQKSDQVEVIVPLAYAMVDGERKSWCESRWDRIQFKKSIADAAVDGIVPEGQLRSHSQALNDHRAWLEKLECEGESVVIEREKIQLSLSDASMPKGLRKISDLTIMNQKINRETSIQTHQRFLDNPSECYDYHEAYREARKDWEVIPYEEAIKWCKERSNYVVGDFGCGEAFLAKELTNKVHSFDHVAINEDVIACDMSNVPLGDACLNVAIFSLSLMGTNFVDYLKEARRCLMLDGHLWIAEPTSRIKDEVLFKELLERIGFYVLCVKKKGKFTFIEALKSGREINEEMVKVLMEQQIFL